MSRSFASPALAPVLDANESARLRNGFAGEALRRERLWRSPAFTRNAVIGLVWLAILLNLVWIVGLDQAMQPVQRMLPDRGPVIVDIIVPPEVFELPPEPVPQPVPAEFRRKPSAIQIEPPQTEMTPPPMNADSSSSTQARIGSAGEAPLQLFNADGSLRLPNATVRIGKEKIENPQEAARAEWAEIEARGENPLDCKRTRFAGKFARDESVGDKVARKYLKWIGLVDGAGIAERAADKERRAADGCDPAE
ncbi:hypothetical protein [Dokdonella sp.]|uniref:hypothetical protein n=1 Tax=Dokdonella sp. TaxID=2291710 RepID=UPI003C47E0A3